VDYIPALLVEKQSVVLKPKHISLSRNFDSNLNYPAASRGGLNHNFAKLLSFDDIRLIA